MGKGNSGTRSNRGSVTPTRISLSEDGVKSVKKILRNSEINAFRGNDLAEGGYSFTRDNDRLDFNNVFTPSADSFIEKLDKSGIGYIIENRTNKDRTRRTDMRIVFVRK